MSVVPPRDDRQMERHDYVDDFPTMDGCVRCGRAAMDPIHRAPLVDIFPLDALGFAAVASHLGAVAHDLGLVVPGFRARAGSDPVTERAIVRNPSGPLVVVPNLRSRTARDTKLDMVDGLCEANGLHHDHPKRWMILDRMELT